MFRTAEHDARNDGMCLAKLYYPRWTRCARDERKKKTQIPSRFRARPRRRLSKLFQIRAHKAEKLFANMEMMLQFVCATPPMRVDERMRDPESHEFLMMMAETTTTTTKSLYICCATTYGSWRRRRCLGKQIKFADAPHPPTPPRMWRKRRQMYIVLFSADDAAAAMITWTRYEIGVFIKRV